MLWLLIGYMFLFIHRPFEVWPILGTVRLELLYMLLTGGLWLVHNDKRLSNNVLHLAFLAFAGAVVVCSVSSRWSDRSFVVLDVYSKFLIFYLILVTVVHDEENLKKLMLGFVGVVGVYMLHSAWEFHNGRHVCRMGIVRMVGVDQTWSDPNAFASSLLLALVFVPVLWRAYPSRRMRQCLAGYVLLAFFCILRTGSRGAFLGLLIWAVVTIWRSPWRARLIPLALAASPLLWFALPEELQNRFLTIVNPEAGPANAQVSGQQRIEGLLIGLELWQQNPLTGIGPGAWRVATGRPIESHNLYGQLMGEMGTFGILTFGSILLAFALNLWRIRSVYRRHPEWGSDFLSDLSAAVGLAIFLLLFEGNFGHNLFRYNYVWYGAFLAIARACVERRLTDPFWRHQNDRDRGEGKFEDSHNQEEPWAAASFSEVP